MLAQFPQAHGEVVTSLTFSPHTPAVLCSTSGDDSAALWDVHAGGGTSVARLQGHHRGPVNHAAFLPNDPTALLTASDDRTIALWDLRRTDRPVSQLTGFQDGVNKLLLLSARAFPSCGLPASGSGGEDFLVASACDDGRVYVHALVPLQHTGDSGDSVSTTSPASPFAAAGAEPAQPFLSPAGALLPAGSLVDCFWASPSTVNDLVLAPSNAPVLITASEDGALRTWRLLFDPNASTEDRLLCSLDEFENPVNHVAVVPQGLILSEEETSAASVAGGDTSPPPHAQRRHAGTGGVGVEEDGEEEEAGGAGGGDDARAVRVRTEYTQQERRDEERRGLRRWVLAACSEFVFGTDLHLQSGEFGQGARSFVGHGDYVRGLEFTRAGTLLTVSDDSTVMEWAPATGEPIRQVKLHDGFVMASALNGAGDVLATGTDRGEIRVWRLPFQTERLGGS